jgi:hypothetical protein
VEPILIRPHHVFQSFTTRNLADRICKTMIPHPSCFTGGVLTLESMLILTLLKMSHPKNVFEFGTYMGATAAILSLNTDDDTKIYTIDLPISESVGNQTASAKEQKLRVARADGESDDEFLIKRSTSVGPVILDGMKAKEISKVTRLYGDSRAYDYGPYCGSMDFIWIDGGHDYDVVKSDTENALKMLNAGNEMATLAWHDYGNPECPEVTQYLNELSESRSFFSIGSTMLCFCSPFAKNSAIEM